MQRLILSFAIASAIAAPTIYAQQGGVLNFELRAWTDQHEDWGRIHSDLTLAINAALIKENLAA